MSALVFSPPLQCYSPGDCYSGLDLSWWDQKGEGLTRWNQKASSSSEIPRWLPWLTGMKPVVSGCLIPGLTGYSLPRICNFPEKTQSQFFILSCFVIHFYLFKIFFRNAFFFIVKVILLSTEIIYEHVKNIYKYNIKLAILL